MSIFSSPHSEITGSEDIIRKSDVLERIDKIKPWHIDHVKDGKFEYTDTDISFRNQDSAEQWRLEQEDPDSIEVYEDDDEATELNALHDLLADFTGGSDSSFAVHEGYLEDYAQEEAESCGIDDDNPFWQFIDWEAAAQAITRGMQSTEFRGSTYWIAAR